MTAISSKPRPGGGTETIIYGPPEQIGTITDPAISEISGLAVSINNNGILWGINDSGHPPVLYALSTTGRTIREFTVIGADNVDWEALAIFSSGNESYLIIADVGDNSSRYDHRILYIIKEPFLNGKPPVSEEMGSTLEIHQEIPFRYEDGPRDCEAIAADTAGERILLLSKRDTPPRLYELPQLFPPRGIPEKKPKNGLGGVKTARKIALLTTLSLLTEKDRSYEYGQYAACPTDMTLSPDGTLLTILTYTNIYQYKRTLRQSWADVLKLRPTRIVLPHPATGQLEQREALARHSITEDLFITSEGRSAPIFRARPLQKLPKH